MLKEKDIEKQIGDSAIQLSDTIHADCIISAEKSKEDIQEDAPLLTIKVNLFRKVAEKRYKKYEYKTKLKRPPHGNILPMRELLIEAISRRLINKEERVVCLQDESLGSGFKGILIVFDVNNLFFDIGQHELTENIKPIIIETVLEIALEIAKQGREGKKIGTSFIIGSDLNNYTKQLIINPFENLEDDRKSILDPKLKETIKEFAQLDGAFILDKEGIIISVGTYLDVDTQNLYLPHGFGARHQSAAAITKVTDAIAVVVSESGGQVRVFKNGQIVMKI